MKKKLLLSLVAGLLLCSLVPETSHGQEVKRKNNQSQRKIVPSDSFYDKIWNKYKLGTKEDKDDVFSVLQRTIKENPEEYMAHYYLGIISSEMGSTNQAIKYFETALYGFPKSSDIHIRLGKIFEEKNNSKEATNHYVQALTLNEEHPTALSKVGISEVKKKEFDKAISHLTKARELEPDNYYTLKALGEALTEKKQYNQAIDVLEQAFLFDEEDPETNLLLGKAYELNGNHEKAAQHISMASKLGKKDEKIANAIGYDIARNLYKSGETQAAIAAYRKEIRKNPNPSIGYYELGEVYDNIGEVNQAIRAYEKAYEINKKHGQAIYRCAELYSQKKDKENTQRMLKILKGNAEFKDRAESMIDALKREEELIAEEELADKINSRGSKDSHIEEAYLENYESGKSPDNARSLYEFYKERGYYDEAIKWYKKYAKESSITDYERKTVEEDLKNRLQQDNYSLFGGKKTEKFSKSKVSDDELMNIAFNGDNDRLKETAFQILLTRKDYKENRKVIEGLFNFYEERGNNKEAIKCINKMKKLGFISESEAEYQRDKLKN